VWPVLVLVGTVLIAWVVMRVQLPAGTPVDNTQSMLVIRTTALVGLNEEWIFRGLLLAAFCRWWGLRRGAFAALVAFSAFHLLNIAGGVEPLASLFQFANTFVLGAIFLCAALGSRSLIIPMVGHALYDFAVIDMNSLAKLTALSPAMAVAPVVGWLLGLWCVYKLWQLRGHEPPYGD
jgi:membrane protease YdiL (CAAX protease family)